MASLRLVALISALLGLDGVLYAIGRFFGGGLPTDVWGTYAAWASALIPATAIYVSFLTWSEGRKAERRRLLLDAANQLLSEKRQGGGTWMIKAASYPVLL